MTPSFVIPFLIPGVESGASPDFADLDAFVGEASGNMFFFENVPEPAGPMSLFSGILAVAAPHDLEIDIKLRSATNPVHPFSRGVIPVAILGSDDFDGNDVPA